MRCGISMKGVDIVVGGDVGHMSAFMAQAGRLVVCGDAGDALGDSIYEARHLRRGAPSSSLGADCVEKRDARRAPSPSSPSCSPPPGSTHDPAEFRRYGSARRLYHFTTHGHHAYWRTEESTR